MPVPNKVYKTWQRGVRARNATARSYRLCRTDNDTLRRLPRFIHQPLCFIEAKEL